jgi:hypothetical protein
MAAARLCQPRQQVQKPGRRGLKRSTLSLYLAARYLANTGHYHRLVNVKTGDALKHHIHRILLNASAAGVGTSLKLNSRQHAPGASPLLGQSGGIQGAPSQTKRRVLQHHRKADLFADGDRYYRLDRKGESFIQGGRPKAGDKLKGKSSIWIAQNVERKLRNFLGHKFWARGYFVSTVGRDEETIRAYIRNQEMADKQLDQLQLKLASS